MGETAIGVSSLVRSVYMVLIVPGFAFAATANTLTSRLIGEGHGDKVVPVLWKISSDSLLCALLPVMLVLLFPTGIVRVFTSDLSLVHSALPVINVVAVATMVSAVSMLFFEAVSGTGNTLVAMLLEFGVLVLYVLYIYFTSKYMEIQWVWTAEWMYNVLMGLIAYGYVRRADWRRKKI
jgi:Na+-driven multidrug efflux pump